MKNNLWENDLVQFSRLVAELEANGFFTSAVLEGLCNSMDLSANDIGSLVSRAQKRYDAIKAKL